MKEKLFQVTVQDQTESYPPGTLFSQIAEAHQHEYDNTIVLVIVDGKLEELYKEVKKNCVLQFVTTAEQIGHKTYERSMCMMMAKAIFDVGGGNTIDQVRVRYNISDGLYCTMHDGREITQEFLDAVKARMHELVEQKILIHKRNVNTDKAIELFRRHGMHDKEKLFYYRRVSRVNIYNIEEFEDYYYGYMVPDTGYLRYFDLLLYDKGFVLMMPNRHHSTTIGEFKPHEKLFRVMEESTRWSDIQGLSTVGSLNDRVTKGDVQQMILVQEALQEQKIAEIAGQIKARPSVKFVLIAGPSSSGKTTFSRRLSVQLRAAGLIPHAISVDNYFVDREHTPVDENGEYDFESIKAIDIDAFNDDLNRMLAGEAVQMPTFNFKTGYREYNGDSITMGESDILVIEGIHCLNDELTRKLPAENKFKIYISALTSISIDEHNRIPTTDGRLIRRMVRDFRTRGVDAAETIARWPSVRRGEEQNIFPYQEQADAMFNSALIYELAVLKVQVEALLFRVERSAPEYLEAKRLLKFLDYFVGIGAEMVPTNSILREFVGGGCFNV
ncbi:MAG: nucleoside kinase [Lachnospiraceae bacterium]|nr:nucleoside kinase [Lachnospiraceae bacterium]